MKVLRLLLVVASSGITAAAVGCGSQDPEVPRQPPQGLPDEMVKDITPEQLDNNPNLNAHLTREQRERVMNREKTAD